MVFESFKKLFGKEEDTNFSLEPTIEQNQPIQQNQMNYYQGFQQNSQQFLPPQQEQSFQQTINPQAFLFPQQNLPYDIQNTIQIMMSKIDTLSAKLDSAISKLNAIEQVLYYYLQYKR